jgi:hypothetical protein
MIHSRACYGISAWVCGFEGSRRMKQRHVGGRASIPAPVLATGSRIFLRSQPANHRSAKHALRFIEHLSQATTGIQQLWRGGCGVRPHPSFIFPPHTTPTPDPCHSLVLCNVLMVRRHHWPLLVEPVMAPVMPAMPAMPAMPMTSGAGGEKGHVATATEQSVATTNMRMR